MATFVLIHGAFRGGWSFRFVRERLQAQGHTVFAPSLTGAGDRAHLIASVLGLETWTLDITRLLESEDLKDVILVGHSMGGFVATAVSERVAERLAHLVFLDAPVPRHGETAAEQLPQDIRRRFPTPERAAVIPPFPVAPSTWIDAELATWINARLTPSPVAPALDPLILTNPKAVALPRTYVFCEPSNEMLPAFHARRRLEAEGSRVRVVEAPHDLILTHPDLVTEFLDGIARDIAQRAKA
jgi:pimeloyl-ACP methyl ester carboxylesterase